MFHVPKLKAEVLLQKFGDDYDVSDEPSYHQIGVVDVDVTDVLALPAEDLASLIKAFGAVDIEAAAADCPNTSCGSPHTMEQFPSAGMRALGAIHGNMGIVSLQWDRFIQQIDENKEMTYGSDDALLRQIELAKAWAKGFGVLTRAPSFHIFEIEERFHIAQRDGEGWKNSGSFETEKDAVVFLSMQEEAAASKAAPKPSAP